MEHPSVDSHPPPPVVYVLDDDDDDDDKDNTSEQTASTVMTGDTGGYAASAKRYTTTVSSVVDLTSDTTEAMSSDKAINNTLSIQDDENPDDDEVEFLGTNVVSPPFAAARANPQQPSRKRSRHEAFNNLHDLTLNNNNNNNFGGEDEVMSFGHSSTSLFGQTFYPLSTAPPRFLGGHDLRQQHETTTTTSSSFATQQSSTEQSVVRRRDEPSSPLSWEHYTRFMQAAENDPGAATAGQSNNLLHDALYISDMINMPPQQTTIQHQPWGSEQNNSNVTMTANKRRRRLKKTPPPAVVPMQKGKSMTTPTGFDALDMYYPHLKAGDRTVVLHQLAAGFKFSKKWTHTWRVAWEKKHGPKSTLWDMVAAFSDEITSKGSATLLIDGKKDKGQGHAADEDDGDRKMPAQPKGSPSGKASNFPSLFPAGKDSSSCGKTLVPATTSIGPLSTQVLNTLQVHFRAYVGRAHHKAMLDAIESVGENDSSRKDSALTCSVCADAFDPSNVVPCSSETELHFFCKPCFVSYATITVQAGPIQGIVCPMPKCNSIFATSDVKSTLSDWDVLMIERREASRDRRVALAGKAVLHCECGAVGIVTESDIGNGRVLCPGETCGRCYCCKCGNYDHGTSPCPPPAETVQWLDKNSKECPNCKNRIEKNGGCDHMTCRPPGGCGHEFWWSCSCPYRQGHLPNCKRASASAHRMFGF